VQAAKYDFYVDQGSLFDETVVWRDNSGTVHDLTNYKAKLSLRKNKADAAATFTFVTGSPGTGQGQITITAISGSIRLVATCALTRAMNFDRCFYDLQLCTSTTDPYTATDTIRIMEGLFFLDYMTTKA
jgi:hypothetical protein